MKRTNDPPQHITSPLLTYQQVAKILGITDRTVYTLVKEGKIRNVRFGHSVRIDPTDLRDFVERSKARPACDSETAVPHAE